MTETTTPPSTADALRRAYDEQLRELAEVATATSWVRIGPVIAAEYGSLRGFITYRSLDGEDGPIDAAGLRDLVTRVKAHYVARPTLRRVEWKTRAHDHAPGLHDALVAAGFLPQEPESIMVGEAQLLAVDVPLPEGVTLRRVTGEDDVRRTCAMQDEVFGGHEGPAMAAELLSRLADPDDQVEVWIAEHGEEIICAGRLEPVPGTDFAGIWGGCTRPPWRGRGIYRALTAARARSAIALGKSLINSDSTEFSRPILERSGLVKVGATTPYEWTRPDAGATPDQPAHQPTGKPADHPVHED